MNRNKGFTLIELLVVIAIIGILAAITFPVFAQAKKSAYKSSDISNMNSIRSALQLYRTDQGGYPPALLGYANLYGTSVDATNIVPAGQVQAALYPKRIDSLNTLRPALLRQSSNSLEREITTAVWPQGVNTGGGAGQPFQRFGPGDGNVQTCVRNSSDPSVAGQTQDAVYYRISGYDVARVKVPGSNGGVRDEIHYAPFWTGWTVPADPCNVLGSESGSATDDVRQLGYTDPPETTVVTWNSFFRDYDSDGNLQHGKQEIVLFLGGAARPFDSVDVATKAWQVLP